MGRGRRHGSDEADRLARLISRRIGKATGEYEFIKEGDRVLLALSGGKDSTTLLRMLAERRRFVPVSYTLEAACVVTDVQDDPDKVRDFVTRECEEAEVPLRLVEAPVTEMSKGPVTCNYCALVRRSVLFSLCRKEGFTTLAFGHHLDDIVATTLMNLFYHANVSTMPPKIDLFEGALTVIRPLVLVEEKTIIEYAHASGMANQVCQCNGTRQISRPLAAEIIAKVEPSCPNVKYNILRALKNIRTGYLGEPDAAPPADE